jgi:hypothetical protein
VSAFVVVVLVRGVLWTWPDRGATVDVAAGMPHPSRTR